VIDSLAAGFVPLLRIGSTRFAEEMASYRETHLAE
jgi:hypothetical protein